MIDTGKRDSFLPGGAAARPAEVEEDALKYWIRRAEQLNMAKQRLLSNHFRRDVTAGPVRIG